MTLMPLRGSDDKIAGDIGTYYAMSAPARQINRDCVAGEKEGGFARVGMSGLLV